MVMIGIDPPIFLLIPPMKNTDQETWFGGVEEKTY
jgi:hypothetical protein